MGKTCKGEDLLKSGKKEITCGGDQGGEEQACHAGLQRNARQKRVVIVENGELKTVGRPRQERGSRKQTTREMRRPEGK